MGTVLTEELDDGLGGLVCSDFVGFVTVSACRRLSATSDACARAQAAGPPAALRRC